MASSSPSSYHTRLSAASPEDRCFTDMQGFWKIYGTGFFSFFRTPIRFCGDNSTNSFLELVLPIVRSMG